MRKINLATELISLACVSKALFLIILTLQLSFGYLTNRIRYETRHFQISAHPKAVGDSAESIALLEDIHIALAKEFEYKYQPRARVVFENESHITNGYAIPNANYVNIYMQAKKIFKRGPSEWLPNLMAHEYGHVVTLRKMGIHSKIYGVGLRTSAHLKNRAYLFGSAFVPRVNVPNWFSEGIAQYAAQKYGADTLDNIRNMIRYADIKWGSFLSLKEMGSFSGGREAEKTYNQGYAFVVYLYEQFDSATMNRFLAQCERSGFEKSAKIIFKKDWSSLYKEWVQSEKNKMMAFLGNREQSPFLKNISNPITKAASAYREDQKAIFNDHSYWMLSSLSNGTGSQSLYQLKNSNRTKELQFGEMDITFNKKKTRLFTFSSEGKAFRNSALSQGMIIDLSSGRRYKFMLPGGPLSAAYHAEDDIYIVCRKKGKARLFKAEKKHNDIQWKLLDIPELQGDILSVTSGRNEDELIIAHAQRTQVGLFSLNLKTSQTSPLTQANETAFQPYVHNKAIYFSSDLSGSFQIHRIVHGKRERISNQAWGAFRPYVYRGKISFVSFEKRGFIAKLADLPKVDSMLVSQGQGIVFQNVFKDTLAAKVKMNSDTTTDSTAVSDSSVTDVAFNSTPLISGHWKERPRLRDDLVRYRRRKGNKKSLMGVSPYVDLVLETPKKLPVSDSMIMKLDLKRTTIDVPGQVAGAGGVQFLWTDPAMESLLGFFGEWGFSQRGLVSINRHWN